MRRPRLDLDGDGCDLHDHCLSCPFTYCQFDLIPEKVVKKPSAKPMPRPKPAPPTKEALQRAAAKARMEAAQRQRDERRAEILRLYATGMPRSAIATAVGMSYTAVSDIIADGAQDTFPRWLVARCISEPDDYVSAKDACRDYAEWADGVGVPVAERMTTAMLGRKLGTQFAVEHHHAGKRYLGIRLR